MLELPRTQGLHTLHGRLEPYSEPLFEIIFVHSLLGDPRLTWTFGDHRWQDWLPEDTDLSKGRIHTFCYESSERSLHGEALASKLQDLGAKLCLAIADDSEVRRSAHNRIIFVAHSLGGLIVKAAIVHSEQSVTFQSLYQRFHSILFFATPHTRASDPTMVRKILGACNVGAPLSPGFVLDTNNLQSINNDFEGCSHNLRIHVFYEANRDPIVPEDRATLPKRGMTPAQAGHTEIVQFSSPTSKIFDETKTVLKSWVNNIRQEFESHDRVVKDLEKIAAFLEVFDGAETDLRKKTTNKIQGSCEWLENNSKFKKWMGKVVNPPPSRTNDGRIFWLTGDPGCGKSFLAAHVVERLRADGFDATFYFFKHGDTTKCTVEDLLRHIAHQRASKSAELRQSLLSLMTEESRLADDTSTLWKRLIQQRVLRMDPERTQYWVIDALDECERHEELLSQLQFLSSKYKIFITSRNDDSLGELFDPLGSMVIPEQIPRDETLKDIRKYLERHKSKLRARSEAELQRLMRDLESKSKGSFLWIHLVVNQLRYLFVESDIQTALRDVPVGMGPLYSRILTEMSRQKNKAWAATILQWVISAVRPLRVTELAIAFYWDTGNELIRPVEAINTYCRSLVEVDSREGIVDVVHHTVREYLFNREAGSMEDGARYFTFDETSCHGHLSIICMKYLNERLSPRSSEAGRKEPFFKYASEHFSEHVAQAAGLREKQPLQSLLSALIEFFKRPVLSWLQHLAHTSKEYSLTTIIRAGINLKAFVDSRLVMDGTPPEQAPEALRELLHWADDLIHIVTVFGKDLLKKSDAIRNVIPALCPLQSMINQKLGNLGVGLQVSGNPEIAWPDLIGSNSMNKYYLTALASSEKHYAANFRLPEQKKTTEQNEIVIFSTETCQETGRISAKEKIRRLGFANGRSWLAAAGWTTLSLYNYEKREEIWTQRTAQESFALAFTLDDAHVITVTREKIIETRDAVNGQSLSRRQIEGSFNPGKPSQQVHISESLGLLALISRNQDVELYDLERLQYPKGRISHSTNIDALAFNTAKSMLVMSAFDKELFTVETESLEKSKSVDGPNAQHMSVSADGNTLIIGTNQGSIEIRDFESLRHLRTIPGRAAFIDLCFVRGKERFLDIRYDALNVWEPAALFRRSEGYNNSATLSEISSRAREIASEADARVSGNIASLTAIVEHDILNFIFCAQEGKRVFARDTAGKRRRHLFHCPNTAVQFLSWNGRSNILASADNASNIRLHRVEPERLTAGAETSGQAPQLWHRNVEQSIRQLLLSAPGDLLLVTTMTHETVLSADDGQYGKEELEQRAEKQSKWIATSRSAQRYVEARNGSTRAIMWSNKSPHKLVCQSIPPQEAGYHGGETHLVALEEHNWAAYDQQPRSTPIVWTTNAAKGSANEAAPIAVVKRFKADAGHILYLLGHYQDNLVFLSSDYWVCSIALDAARLSEPINYHFPVPHYWRNTKRSLIGLVTKRGEVAMTVGDALVVVNGVF